MPNGGGRIVAPFGKTNGARHRARSSKQTSEQQDNYKKHAPLISGLIKRGITLTSFFNPNKYLTL